MVKRFVSVGAACLCALLFSFVSLADTRSEDIAMSFPYFGYARVRHGSSELYLGSKGSLPISSVTYNVASPLSTSGTSIIIDLYMGGTYTKQYTSSDSSTFSYTIPVYSTLYDRGSDISGSISTHDYIVDWNSGHTEMEGFDAGRSSDHVSVTESAHYIDVNKTDRVYTGSLSNSSQDTIVLDNGYIPYGNYALTGYINIAAGSISTIDDLFTGSVVARILDGSNTVICEIDSVDLYINSARLLGNNVQQIPFALSFNVPSTDVALGQLQFLIGTKSTKSVTIESFSISTGALEIPSRVENLGGLAYSIGSWLSSIKSEIVHISSALKGQASAQEQAASKGDSSGNTDAQSKISDIESYEADLNTQIDLSVQSIDFTVPSTYGGALSAVGYIFTSVFNAIGGYQVVLTIPLILGIMLLLVGRGYSSVGRIYRRKDD